MKGSKYMWLLIAFIAVPVIEIALFIQVGGFIGMWPTLLIVILTALAGTYLVRSQGRLALGQLQQSFNELRDPTGPLVHGAMILFSGALLLTPGFFTDAVGFALLIPAVREAAFKAIRARIKVQGFTAHTTQRQSGHPADAGKDVIDGEFIELPDDDTPKGQSGWTRH
jgi:UPF0716 protein FxsA